MRCWAGDDLVELQSEPLEAIQKLVEPYAPCIIQGCEVNDMQIVTSAHWWTDRFIVEKVYDFTKFIIEKVCEYTELVQTDRVIPIEVKAEGNVRSRSMSEYIKSHPQYNLKGLRISMLNYKDQDWMENIPLFGLQKFF